MGFLKALAITLLAIVVALVAVAGYLGFVPGVSNLFGSNKPRDLGVAYSAESGLKAARVLGLPVESADFEKISKNPDAAKSFSGEISDAEASSFVLLRQAQIANFPIYLARFKFNPDNTAEVAGMLRVRNIAAFLQDTGVSTKDAETVVNTLKLAQDAPFYLKGKAQISDNRVTLDVSQVEIGRLPVPTSLFESNKGTVESYVGNVLTTKGFRVKTMTVSNGKVKLEGTRPLSALGPWVKAFTPAKR